MSEYKPHKKYKYIFIDLDNTLLDDLGVAREPLGQIASYASYNNIVLYIATARGLYFAQSLARDLGKSKIGFMCYDGAYVVNERHTVLIDEFLESDQFNALAAIVSDFWEQGKLFCSTKENIYAAKNTLGQESSLSPFLKISDQYPQKVYQLYFRDLSKHDAHMVQQSLEQHGMFSYLFQSSRQGFGILANRGTNKAEAIRQIMQHDGNSLSECIVVGDGINDIDIFNLQQVVKIAAPHALPVIKNKADYCMRNDELLIDTVRNVLQEIINT